MDTNPCLNLTRLWLHFCILPSIPRLSHIRSKVTIYCLSSLPSAPRVIGKNPDLQRCAPKNILYTHDDRLIDTFYLFFLFIIMFKPFLLKHLTFLCCCLATARSLPARRTATSTIRLYQSTVEGTVTASQTEIVPSIGANHHGHSSD